VQLAWLTNEQNVKIDWRDHFLDSDFLKDDPRRDPYSNARRMHVNAFPEGRLTIACPHVHVVLLEPPLQTIVQYIVSRRPGGENPHVHVGGRRMKNDLQILQTFVSSLDPLQADPLDDLTLTLTLSRTLIGPISGGSAG